MTLKQWLEQCKSNDSKKTFRAFARDLGITACHLSCIVNLKKCPSVRLCGKIQDNTKGKVSVSELLRYWI